MCKVYEFPTKKTLPYGMEQDLKRFARAYVEMIDIYSDELLSDCYTEEGMNEIIGLVSETLMYEIALAVYEIE